MKQTTVRTRHALSLPVQQAEYDNRKDKACPVPTKYAGKTNLFILILALIITSCQTDKPTNVLFILVDDLGYMDIACYGSSFYETPNIDKLAEQGVMFTNAYAACPVCSPTRASILTGRYPTRTGVTDWIPGRQANAGAQTTDKLIPLPFTQQLELEEETLAEVFKENGYKTFFAGKWHLGNKGYFPEDQGFDINIGGHHKGGPYGKGVYFSPYNIPGLEKSKPNEYLPDRLTTETIQFMKKHKNEPFFAYLSFYAVHNPIMAKSETILKYRKKQLELGYHITERFDRNADWIKKAPPTSDFMERVVQDDPTYAAMIEHVDDNIGRLMGALTRMNLHKNTLIVFTSDNGGLSTAEGSNTSNLPLRGGKGWIYEGGIREPLLVYWPENPNNGEKSETVISSVDFLPTLIDIFDLRFKPSNITDGRSFVPALKGRKMEDVPVFWHYPHYGNQGCKPAGAVRLGDYKLIEFFEDSRLELYNLKEDIGEKNNLAAKMPEKTAELHKLLQDWRKETGAKGMNPNPGYIKPE